MMDISCKGGGNICFGKYAFLSACHILYRIYIAVNLIVAYYYNTLSTNLIGIFHLCLKAALAVIYLCPYTQCPQTLSKSKGLLLCSLPHGSNENTAIIIIRRQYSGTSGEPDCSSAGESQHCPGVSGSPDPGTASSTV